ncbi:peptidase [candidate division KSB1 bacterium]|nr:peptidase [candidate division KSB1 bacterium]
MHLYSEFESIFSVAAVSRRIEGEEIGHTRSGLPISAFRFGSGSFRISLVAGCHADEPVGPMFLEKLVVFLSALPEDHPFLCDFDWSIVPHINLDGRLENAAWTRDADKTFDPIKYLRFRKREEPGDDVEFGFPALDDDPVRPENLALYRWWRKQRTPFDLHVSLHGMGFGAGPWFLLSPQWSQKCPLLIRLCLKAVFDLHYELHDVERLGEKGFFRIGRGFCTHPVSEAMKRHFIRQNRFEIAEKFYPSSMECIRSFGGDPLTLVSEIPLFITPGVGVVLGPPDPKAEMWLQKIDAWGKKVRESDHREIYREMKALRLQPMPIRHQMQLQWRLITAGIEQLLDQR